jgi:hypothetical protein
MKKLVFATVLPLAMSLPLMATSSYAEDNGGEDITQQMQDLRDFTPSQPDSLPSSVDLGHDVSVGIGTGATPDARGDSGFGGHITVQTK